MVNNNIIFSEYPDIVTIEQLSTMLRISKKTAYKLIKEKKIRSFIIGRSYVIPKIYILEFLKSVELSF